CKRSYPSQEFRRRFVEQTNLPTCEYCGSILKPDIVLFEEALPLVAWAEAQQHCERADVVLVAGSSLEVSPANRLPVFALENNARLIINNLSPTYLDAHAALLLPLDAAIALPRIVELMA
ncbi:MAG: Sir2 family NAD-dependent protein deacetylase, partial [Anaerolineaceae bacterium]|nr:Sir2 family NAD-dependent protein deacetylase [Anaerolineaceae bacterium]